MRTRVGVEVILISSVLLAQEYRGTFSGKVTDPQNAPVAGARITATETNTGTRTECVSESTGAYTLSFLAPGTYEIKVEAPGFKQHLQTGLTLSASEHPVIDIQMQLGATSDSVTVSAEPSTLISSNASVGQTITTEEVEDLPVNGRTPLELATLAMGVVNSNQPGPVRLFDNPGRDFPIGRGAGGR